MGFALVGVSLLAVQVPLTANVLEKTTKPFRNSRNNILMCMQKNAKNRRERRACTRTLHTTHVPCKQKQVSFEKKKAVNGAFIYCVFLTAVEEKKLCVKLSDGTRRCSDSKGPETIIPS